MHDALSYVIVIDGSGAIVFTYVQGGWCAHDHPRSVVSLDVSRANSHKAGSPFEAVDLVAHSPSTSSTQDERTKDMDKSNRYVMDVAAIPAFSVESNSSTQIEQQPKDDLYSSLAPFFSLPPPTSQQESQQKSKSKFTRTNKEPQREDFQSDKEYSENWEAWRRIRDSNNVFLVTGT